MQVHFTPELEAKLAQSAALQGRNPDDLVQEVVARKRYSAASTSHMSKWASALSDSCSPDAG
jgi:hypothetical protein